MSQYQLKSSFFALLSIADSTSHQFVGLRVKKHGGKFHWGSLGPVGLRLGLNK